MRLFLTLVLLNIITFAAPAYSGTRQYTQPDGTVVHYTMQGDEHLHWLESEDGEVLLHNEKAHCLEYATIKDGNLKTSGQLYTKKTHLYRAAAQDQINIKKVTNKEIEALYQHKRSTTLTRKHGQLKRASSKEKE